MSVQILQGECELAKDNHKVDEMTFGGLTSAPAGYEKINLTYSINVSGVLEVTAKDARLGHSQQLIITSDKMNLPEEEVSRLAAQGEFERTRSAQRIQMAQAERQAQSEYSTPN